MGWQRMPGREAIREAAGSGAGSGATRLQHKAPRGPAEDLPSEMARNRLPGVELKMAKAQAERTRAEESGDPALRPHQEAAGKGPS